MWQYRADCLGVLLLQVLLLALGLAELGFTGVGIDVIRHHLDPSTPAPRWPFDLPLPSDIGSHTALWMLACGVFVFALVRTLGTYFYTVRLTHLVQARIVVDLRSRVYEKLQYLSFRFFDSNASGSIINRVTGDVQSVRMFVDEVVMQGFILVLSLGVYLAYMLGIHAKLTLVCLAGTPLLWWLSARFARLVKPAYRRNRELLDRMILALAENIQGIQVIKAFALENAEIGRFRKTNDEVRDQQEWMFRQVSLFSPLIGLLSQLNIVLLLAYGGWLVVHNQIPLGTGLVVFTGILQQFSGQISNIAGIANSMQQSLTAADRVFEVITGPIAARDISGILWGAAGFAALMLFTQFTMHFRQLPGLQLGEAVIHDMRADLFQHLQRMTMGFFHRTRLGQIISRMTSDVESVRVGVQDVLFVSVVQGGQMLVAATLMLLTDPVLFGLVMAMAPGVWALNRHFCGKISQAHRDMQESFSRVTSTLAESVNGMRVTQGFGRQEINAGLFRALVQDHSRYNMGAARTSGVFLPLLELNSQFFIAALMLLGGNPDNPSR